MRSSLAAPFATLIVACLAVPVVQGAYVVNVVQSGLNVVASGSGTLNLTALTNFGTGSGQPGVFPTNGNLGVGVAAGDTGYDSISGPSSFGSGPFVAASSATGSYVQLGLGAGGFYVAQSYVSGTQTSGTATWNNTTIAALGLTPGTYTYTWGGGATADSFTVNIGTSPTATPAPSSLYLAAMAVLLLAAWQLVRMRKSDSHE